MQLPTPKTNEASQRRYAVLDGLRGFALLNMIAYHTIWDMVWIFGFSWHWYTSQIGYLWQQAICQTFILLSGFCLPLGRHGLKRGITVFLAGAAVSAVTLVFMPENRVVFGVLTLIGSCMIYLSLARPLLQRCPAAIGTAVSLALFLLTKHIARGYIGIGTWPLFCLPKTWYANWFTAYLGLPMANFFSTDYFALFPWLFLFSAGYFLNPILVRQKWFAWLEHSRCPWLEWIGRHSLMLYLCHQPLIYLMLTLLLQ